MTKGFKIIHRGVLTTYQDLGRHGFRRFGIPLSGAMDAIALRAANLLVGNKETEVGLEVTLMGLKMVALSPLLIAVTGGDLNFAINSEYQPPWKNYRLKPGDILHFRRRKSGLRAYLAVRGGFKAPAFMGSASVFQRGLMGNPLGEGEPLEIGTAEQRSIPEFEIPQDHLPNLSDQNLLRVIMGPQEERFTEEGILHFLNGSYRIKSQSDRMAYRLEGPKINHRGKADIISEPLMPGAIQVPNDGAPIILMVDGQVTGGYAKIANVIRADIPVLAQKIPGEEIQFESVDLDRAYEALEQQEQFLLRLGNSLSFS
jgi:antagonist of KipI